MQILSSEAALNSAALLCPLAIHSQCMQFPAKTHTPSNTAHTSQHRWRVFLLMLYTQMSTSSVNFHNGFNRRSLSGNLLGWFIPANIDTHIHTLWPYIPVADCYSPSFRPLWHKKENTIWWSAAQTIYKASCNGCLEAKCNRAAEFHLFRKLGKHYVVLPEYFFKRRGYVTFTPPTYLSRFTRVNATNIKWHYGDIYPLPHDDFLSTFQRKKMRQHPGVDGTPGWGWHPAQSDP